MKKYNFNKVENHGYVIIENGHTMFPEDVIRRFERLNYLEEQFQPKQESLMTEKVKMTEEQAREMLNYYFHKGSIEIETFIKTLKEKEHILPDPVEEAEEMYENHIRYFSMGVAKDLIEKQHEAIQYLKEKK